jgi:hypothetical protein
LAKVMTTSRRVVSKDGKTMTLNITGTNAKGQKVKKPPFTKGNSRIRASTAQYDVAARDALAPVVDLTPEMKS